MFTFIAVAVVGLLFWALFAALMGGAKTPTPAHGSSIAGTQVDLAGEGLFDFDVVGESFYQAALERLTGGKTDESVEINVRARLFHDDQNQHDENAVAVLVRNEVVGHLSRTDAAAYRREMAAIGLKGRDAYCEALIVGGWARGERGEGTYGVKLDLEWPPSRI